MHEDRDCENDEDVVLDLCSWLSLGASRMTPYYPCHPGPFGSPVSRKYIKDTCNQNCGRLREGTHRVSNSSNQTNKLGVVGALGLNGWRCERQWGLTQHLISGLRRSQIMCHRDSV